MDTYKAFYNSPVGLLSIEADEENIIAVLFVSNNIEAINAPGNNEAVEIKNRLLQKCISQLKEYFDGTRKQFDLPVRQTGSDFQQKVWTELTRINYGKTISYLELSKRIQNVKAIRAVGTTNGKNNISIIVPCHRVIGNNGDLTGYAGGLWRKKWLLDHENKFENGLQTLF